MAVKFEDYSVQVIGEVNDRINARLEEVAGEIESAAKRNTRGKGQTKNAWSHYVDTDSHTAYIGNPLENAIWEEFGTGEHALKGNGRKGYWVFVKGASGTSSNQGKSYTLKEAKKVMRYLRDKGLDAYYTNGKKPSRAFHKAYTALKNKVIRMLENSLKGL